MKTYKPRNSKQHPPVSRNEQRDTKKPIKKDK